MHVKAATAKMVLWRMSSAQLDVLAAVTRWMHKTGAQTVRHKIRRA